MYGMEQDDHDLHIPMDESTGNTIITCLIRLNNSTITIKTLNKLSTSVYACQARTQAAQPTDPQLAVKLAKERQAANGSKRYRRSRT
ncbi:hypothetical protein DPMN_002398 [Dreissena polymorpha]|uniref:Uncharacterized protein n=1 Tax=Dreissena polymorpha TaxID=45954 RepID=A0A9D4MNL0_DREPO|nr:hypothetical protein DPMN_002398 [Dreissena polymorpha]